MNLLQRKLKFLELNPVDICSAELDGFCPYLSVDIPSELECDELHVWVQDVYIYSIQDNGGSRGIEEMKQVLLTEAVVNIIEK